MTLFIVVISIAFVLLVVLGLIVSYNRFIRQRNLVQESWRQIDVELHRRYDLIPNLVETVRSYAAHERGVFEEISRLRSQAVSGDAAGLDTRARQESALSGALRQLFAVVENYPALKSNQNFVALQQQLAETEDRIAAGRRFYNANVRAYNTRVEAFPSNLIASMFSFVKAEYFEVEEVAVRAAPQVDFSALHGGTPTGQPPVGQPGWQQPAAPGQVGTGQPTYPPPGSPPPGMPTEEPPPGRAPGQYP